MKLKELKDKNVNIHVAATGAGAGLQSELWEVPGCSSYLSGASFPYAPEEHEELVGFKPEHYCSEEDAIDLALAAYMKAYRFGGKKPVGIGITASVASEKEHRGDHRIFGCIMTDDKVLSYSTNLEKGSGSAQRFVDGQLANHVGIILLNEAFSGGDPSEIGLYKNCTELAIQRFWLHSLFLPDGRRLNHKDFNFDGTLYALMPGAFNPPHEGHFGLANAVKLQWRTDVIFEICATHPIKPTLTVQQMLQRAKLLRGHHILFTQDSLYIDKARAHPNMPLVVGADAMLRILDPQWGNPEEQLKEFTKLGTEFWIASRLVDGKLITKNDIMNLIPISYDIDVFNFRGIKGQWDISSTEIRNKI
jgi:nicotinic acid mononucleotide adenylyltransferase/nicotinamide mononucleotide (NMN) deamidase PncC